MDPWYQQAVAQSRADIDRRGLLAPPDPRTLSGAVQQQFGLLAGLDRPMMWPSPDRAVGGGVDWSNWTAPEWMYEGAKAVALPGHVMRGGEWSPEDVTNMALTVGGSAGAASMAGGVPRGALGMGALKQADMPMDEASRMARRIKDLRGNSIDAPRTFYRGQEPGRTERISTGIAEWDDHMFAADAAEKARWYGREVTKYSASPDAKILYEGTADWNKVAGKIKKDENLLQYATRAARAAKEAGYDAAWFKSQTDVGTAIFNPEKFKPVARGSWDDDLGAISGWSDIKSSGSPAGLLAPQREQLPPWMRPEWGGS